MKKLAKSSNKKLFNPNKKLKKKINSFKKNKYNRLFIKIFFT